MSGSRVESTPSKSLLVKTIAKHSVYKTPNPYKEQLTPRDILRIVENNPSISKKKMYKITINLLNALPKSTLQELFATHVFKSASFNNLQYAARQRKQTKQALQNKLPNHVIEYILNQASLNSSYMIPKRR